MVRIFIAILCILFSLEHLSAAVDKRTIEIQKSGKIDICHIGDIDDGDTFDLDCRGGYYPNVRLLGVNTPDYNHHTE